MSQDGWAMTDRNADPPAQADAKRLQFDRFALDLRRGCLLLDGNEIVLRPKTFAVLRHLVDNPGRLVSKDELFAAVWPTLPSRTMRWCRASASCDGRLETI